VGKTWKKYWFILDKESLYYFSDEDTKKAKGMLHTSCILFLFLSILFTCWDLLFFLAYVLFFSLSLFNSFIYLFFTGLFVVCNVWHLVQHSLLGVISLGTKSIVAYAPSASRRCAFQIVSPESQDGDEEGYLLAALCGSEADEWV
jgi:hypothetical protein